MSDENKTHEGPQDFELIELLFKDITAAQNQPGASSSIPVQSQEPFYSFEARFQSFINQIPSYLHSSEKEGFFTHFFLGSFSTLLDTELKQKLNVEKLHFCFDEANTLKVVAKTKFKTHIFIFTEDTVINELEFTKDELETLGVDCDKDNIDFKLIKINKLIGNKTKEIEKITVQVTSENISNYEIKSSSDIKFKEITHHPDRCLEKHIINLASSQENKVKMNFEKLLTDIKNIHKDLKLPDKVYGNKAREANQHGFLAGALYNFRYRHNFKIYLEQFAGRGYADIILLVRGGGPEPQHPYRIIDAVPIVIELKAGKDKKNITIRRKRKSYEMQEVPGITPTDALNQAKGYAEGFQPNKLRVLTLAKHIICAGINLDHEPSTIESILSPIKSIASGSKKKNSSLSCSFKTESVPIVQPQRPLIDSLLKIDKNNTKKEIKNLISREYYTFPPTPEKSNELYFSRFFLGQMIPVDNNDFENYIFIFEEVNLKPKPKTTFLRPERKSAKKSKLNPEETSDDSRKNDVTSIMSIPKKQQYAILFNIIENDEGDFPKIKLDGIAEKLANKEIMVLNIWFDTSKKPNNKGNEFKNYLEIKDINKFNSLKDYNDDAGYTHSYDGGFKQISCSDYFKKYFEDAINSQKNHLDDQPIFSSQAYKKLFIEIGTCVFPFKDLIKGETSIQKHDEEESEIDSYEKKYEALIQAVLHGLFNHHSDSRLIENPETIELVATEFQTGAGSRIDMMIQGIVNSPQGSKEHIPVGLELKYGELSDTEEVNLRNQMERYNHGLAIKAITDSKKVIIMGIVFKEKSDSPTTLFELIEPQDCGIVTHSSIFQSPFRIFPVSNLSQSMSSTPDLTPISSNINNVVLLPRQPGPNVSGLPGTSTSRR